MRWQGGRRSSNIEDRRSGGAVGRSGPRVALGGGGVLLLLVVGLLFGADPAQLLEIATGGGAVSPAPAPSAPAGGPGDVQADFVSVVLADTEDTWTTLFRERGAGYAPPKLVLFRGAVDSACGYATSAVGPFYCPGDRKVYLDLAFFDELGRRFGAPGDFAQAYVVAHEVGHHVQTITGVSDRVNAAQRGRSEAEQNALSVRQELQADCYAGVWAHHAERARDLLEQGDVEEGLAAATAIGDDTLQRRSGGHVQPETFTHGSSAQRVRWFRRGLDSGSLDACDTFAAPQL